VKLKNLSLQYYSGFYGSQKLDFAIPNGSSGSGLTLIMGENNSGKTSIVDIFGYLANQEQESLKASELFFYDNVLLVEGQEDFSLLQNWLNTVYNDQPFEIFGYGVGGVDNIPTFLEITRNLGFSKVAVLTDKIECLSHEWIIKEWEIKNEDWIKDQTRYLRRSLKTEDIRDKYDDDGNKIKEGYFDKNQKIKEEYKAHLKEIFDSFYLFFNQEGA